MGIFGKVLGMTLEMIIGMALMFVTQKYFNREATGPVTRNKDIARRFGRRPFVTNSFEDVIAGGVIDPDNINVDFNSIGGLENIKKELTDRVILPLIRPELFTHGKLLGPQKGVLLYGPPGTGKTTIAKAIAKQAGAVFINVSVSDLMSKWFGDAPKLVAAVFTLAYKLQPAIIFIDEVDSFLGQRNSDHDHMTPMKTEFMSRWEGFTTDQNAMVMVLAATNRREVLDEAILRRFSQSFEIGLPNRKERASILQIILKDENVEMNIDYDYLAGLCEGYTGSDLTKLCEDAAVLPLGEYLEAETSGISFSGGKAKGKDDSFETATQNVKENDDYSFEREVRVNCKYFDRPGGCKFGKACKFNHSKKVSPTSELNFMGLPIRPGEKECPYYMRNGSCKFGANCRFNHPDPTSGGEPIPSPDASQSTRKSWSPPAAVNENPAYLPLMFPQTQGVPAQPEWSAYQAPVYPLGTIPMAPTYAMYNQPSERNNFSHQREPIDEFPERPGQPECSFFLKTGNCKYKSACKFHHPKNVLEKSSACSLSELGLPLRPAYSMKKDY